MGFLHSDLSAVDQVVWLWGSLGVKAFFFSLSARLWQECGLSDCRNVSWNTQRLAHTCAHAFPGVDADTDVETILAVCNVIKTLPLFCESLLLKSELAAGEAVCCGGRNLAVEPSGRAPHRKYFFFFFFTGMERRPWKLK